MKYQVRNTPILKFREMFFKIPLFSLNLEQTLDANCFRRVATGERVVWNCCTCDLYGLFNAKNDLPLLIQCIFFLSISISYRKRYAGFPQRGEFYKSWEFHFGLSKSDLKSMKKSVNWSENQGENLYKML